MIVRKRLLLPLLAFCLLSVQFKTQAAPQKSSEKTFKVSGPVVLEVKTGSEDLSVRGGEDGNVVVRCIVRPQSDHDYDDEDAQRASHYIQSHLPVRQDGNRIVIEPLTERAMMRRVNVQYEITAPANSRLTYETGSGDLSVEAIKGPVESSSGSGDVRARSVKEGVRVHTGSGDVTLEDMSKGPIEVSTQSGDVMVQLDPKAGYDLSAHTGSGDFSVNSQLTLEAGDTSHDIHGKVRGGGAAVTLRTGSGDIQID